MVHLAGMQTYSTGSDNQNDFSYTLCFTFLYRKLTLNPLQCKHTKLVIDSKKADNITIVHETFGITLFDKDLCS